MLEFRNQNSSPSAVGHIPASTMDQIESESVTMMEPTFEGKLGFPSYSGLCASESCPSYPPSRTWPAFSVTIGPGQQCSSPSSPKSGQ